MINDLSLSLETIGASAGRSYSIEAIASKEPITQNFRKSNLPPKEGQKFLKRPAYPPRARQQVNQQQNVAEKNIKTKTNKLKKKKIISKLNNSLKDFFLTEDSKEEQSIIDNSALGNYFN